MNATQFTVQTIKAGDGKTFAKKGNKVIVHYTGKFPNGTVFDSSVGRDPFEFTLGAGEVINGWDLGVAKMSVGETAKITCPPSYAYGAAGAGGVIPPNATLIFDVEFLRIKS